MKAGIQIPRFNYGKTEDIAPTLINIAQVTEEAGFSSITVMDHYFQIHYLGPYTDPMLEGYTTLSFLAAHTKKTSLGTLVTGVIYRQPAFLVKQVTTLDVLSEGRAFLGIGAAWNEEESKALGFPFPPVKERFERLEEALQIAKQMWSGDKKQFLGKYYTLENPYNSPQPISRPHPPILIGGSGEQKTLLLVAKYADACNLFAMEGIDIVKHKLDILKKHCDTVGRNYDEIEKTTLLNADPNLTQKDIIQRCKDLASIGIDKIFFGIPHMEKISPIESFGKEVISQIDEF